MNSLISHSILLLLLASTPAVAGTDYQACRHEEKLLRESEADKCSGFAKLVNPSGCVAAQAALKEYDAGKCWKIGGTEKTIPGNTPRRLPLQDSHPPATRQTGTPASPPKSIDAEKLQAENTLLKNEITRLREEINRLQACEK